MAILEQVTDRGAAQCRDPTQTGMFLQRVDLRLCEHPSITDQDDPGEAELFESLAT